MDRIFRIDSSTESKGSITLQTKMVEHRRKPGNNVPDLTDFMNDMFFGTADKDKKAYNLTGGRLMDEEVDFDDSTRSNSGRLTQEWLEEAKRMVASSPSQCDSPSRLVGSPRFAAAQARLSASSLDRRDPLSRSARRYCRRQYSCITYIVKFMRNGLERKCIVIYVKYCFIIIEDACTIGTPICITNVSTLSNNSIRTGTGQWRDSVEKS